MIYNPYLIIKYL